MTLRTSKRQLGALIRAVRLVVFDFDGVFTDNTVLAFDDGTEAVRCWRGDGLGLRLLQRLGVETQVLSLETNQVVGVRCRKLGIPFVQGCEDKRSALLKLLEARGLSPREVAYVGNDLNDRACLEVVGLPIVVADAHPSVLPVARWRTTLRGGRGAVREICDRFEQERRVGSHSRTRRVS